MLSTGVDRRCRCRCRGCWRASTDAAAALAPDGGEAAAGAILTTDAGPKQAAVSRGGFTVGGMAKGAGMIHPCLATMLAVVTTDYPLEPGEAHGFLRAGGRRELQPDLGRRRVLDERHGGAARERRERAPSGTTRRSRPRCARSVPTSPVRSSLTARARPCCSRSRSPALRATDEARAIARRIATSPLVKTAAFGHDANWGRVLVAAGSAAVQRRLRAARPGPAHGRVQRHARLRRRCARRRRARRRRAASAGSSSTSVSAPAAPPTSPPTSRTTTCAINAEYRT